MDKLEKLRSHYLANPITPDLPRLVKEELGLDIRAKYGPYALPHPFLVAPGQLTLQTAHIAMFKKAGYAGAVLKSVVGEDGAGRCSMPQQKKKPTRIESVYDPEDTDRARPIIHWDGRADTRDLKEYLVFAEESSALHDDAFRVVASLLCHLPLPGEEIAVEEWHYTTARLHSLGYRLFEIDFCPWLSGDEARAEQANILRWYRDIPRVMKSAAAGITVYPKMINLDWGLDYQMEMAQAAVEGDADGLIVANRLFKKEMGCAHGGRELRENNLRLVREIRRAFPKLAVSATGGVYSGRHARDYLAAGAENVQLLSYLMGRVHAPFEKKGNKAEQILFKLLFDRADGLLACLLDLVG